MSQARSKDRMNAERPVARSEAPRRLDSDNVPGATTGAAIGAGASSVEASPNRVESEAGASAPLWWAEAVRLKDTMGLRALADHLGVRVGALAAELRRSGLTRSPQEPAVAVAQGVRPGSQDGRILSHYHLLGHVPDAEVARMSGVSIRTIASYRARHGIAGYSGPRRRPEVRGRRESRLEDHRDVLGTLPDRVVADLVGMSLGAVRNYRVKHAIPAAGRISQRRIDAHLSRIANKPAAKAEAPRAAEPRPVARVAPPRPAAPVVESLAWRVRLGDADGTRDVVIVAATMADAIARAEAIATGGSTVMALERLGPLIGGT
jgi:hypothetical protein